MKKFSLVLMILVLMTMSILFITACDEKTTEPVDTEDPTVIITYPANNAEIISGTLVTIQTDVNDNEGVDKVDFYIDGSNVATDYNSPYNYEWDTTDITGNHTIYAKAIDDSDNEGISNIITIQLNEPFNNAPSSPSNPSPSNNANFVSQYSNLYWSCTDLEGDPLTFDVHFGTSSNPPLVNSGQSEFAYELGVLDFEETYFWQIVAYDDHSNSTTGAVWEFTTYDGLGNSYEILIIGSWSKYYENNGGWTHILEFQNNGIFNETIIYNEQSNEENTFSYSIAENQLTLEFDNDTFSIVQIIIENNILTLEELIASSGDWDIPLPANYVRINR